MMVEEMPGAGTAPQDWLDWTTRQQTLASDPARSAWVSANAGSGKTHVLTQRVIRLLLSGSRPSAVLCLTYTKAAASEMSNRVFELLARWATLPDDQLSRQIAAIEGTVPDSGKLREARRLFARALETPGGLKIQTIHAFCEALLHQFPLEANLAGHFSVLDDRAASVLLADARRALLTATTSEDDQQLASAFATVLDLADDMGLEKLISAIVQQRTALRAFTTTAERTGGVERTLRAVLDLADDETEADVLDLFWPLPGLSGAVLERYLTLADSHGGVKAADFAAGLRAVRVLSDSVKRYEGLYEIFFTQAGKQRAESAFLSKRMLSEDPGLQSLIQIDIDHINACRERLHRIRIADATFAALTLATRLDEDYEDLKRRRSQLDFEDLINRAARLLSRDDVSAWVHYKLDQGIDHVLVDEAQDTSPVQWSIIRSLTGEFFAGETAREASRSVFAVGDEKQSIYSFQGARPERFSEERTATERRIRQGGSPFSPVSLQLSFRSTSDVLSAVDTVFAVASNAKGLSAADVPVIHASNRIGEPGAVDVWETIKAEPNPAEDDWTAAFDSTPESAPANILANRIAATLQGWIGKETIIEKGTSRPIEPGDIIVLVRKRDRFVNALTRALKSRENIPVAGADRLVLTSHIAIQDLLALGRFVLLPEDDLSLCALLKSPLFDFSEEDVFAAAVGREEGTSVWANLQAKGGAGEGRISSAADRLRTHIAEAARFSVHDFFARVLGPHGGRRAFLARMGSEVSDILDEFLTFALDYETNGIPGLQAFVSALEMEAPTVKREQDKERNEVRIMTVHAAKGLEAPVVFLVDGGSRVFSSQHLSPLRLVDGLKAPFDETPVPFWLPPKTPASDIISAHAQRVREAAEEEYRRLLYVGMTRAADRLIVCGYSGSKPGTGTWHEMVYGSLASDDRGTPAEFSANGETWSGLSWRSGTGKPQTGAGEPPSEEARSKTALPASLARPLPPQKGLPRPLSPSGAGAVIDDGEADVMVGSPLFSESMAESPSLQRGAVMHRLLEVLPSFDLGERRTAAERYVDRSLPQWPASQKTELVQAAFGVLTAPELEEAFSGKSQAEVAIMGTLKLGAKEFAVSGRIDRLAVADGVVSIIDFKTNRTFPTSEGDVTFEHRAQLAIYRALLQPLYPRHRIECTLVYTEGPAVVRLSAAALEASLAQLSTK